MEHSKHDIIALSYSYHHNHGVKDSDVEKANFLSKLIEDTRAECPMKGDIVICKGPNKVYSKGHLDRSDIYDYSSICVQPYVPFVFANDDGISLSTSGGYWFSVPEGMKLKYIGKDKKTFKAWGHCGACADGAFRFQAIVNIWEIFLENIY